jgi:hypothetical protein
MAVEIRELVIKATILNADDVRQKAGNSTADKAQLIQECVKEVLKIMEKRKNR